MSIITFLSDFGDRDWFVAAVKGRILAINSRIQIIDISHKLTNYDIRSAAFLLKAVYKNFPEGTIHLAVVDPGVGGPRRPIIVQSAGYYFVGPDNGIFSLIYEKDSKVYAINWNKPVSSTFHARDIFGPVAAKLSKGIRPKGLGCEIRRYVKFDLPALTKKGNKIAGEIVYIDHFGNLLTNIPNETELRQIELSGTRIEIKKYYAEGSAGAPIAVKGSSGYYEIASNKGNAKKLLNARIGMKILAKI